ncbi:tRNA (cytosine(34)-C(5))-methyltransferase [Oopsacas minuta]|uniref:tRNA (cytosine(34)-C(5))-methyltransferase n=1 Tax=Oopsacas minuta TaxID=111878 RepID=A0AAV7JUM3_9METZ|nr:tRNA (cytosine(34)-C(5))-methyltransferase [Oopsacas minuta]
MATKRVFDVKSRSKSAKKRKRERPKQPRIDYEEIEKENKLFEEFYTEQGIISPSEWIHFMSTVRLPLPATFRLTSNTCVCTDLADCLTQRYIQKFPKLSTNNEPINPPIPIPWYPSGLAWHVDITRKEIRNDPVLASYHSFLMRETDIGSISRQEAVSMIPPLFLDVQSHHKVLDMCAAPGSKTTQIIEAMHQSHAQILLQLRSSQESTATGLVPNPLPPGFVVANDSNNKRSYLLVHQAKRKKSANVIVTNHDGTTFPNLYLSQDDHRTGNHIKYDRVLCDVPCSGDGTIRKNPTVWMKWAPHKANGLHRLQLRLVVRGAELLVDGGRLVYSTCSMNPIENEAVIHTLLKLGEGSLQLVDVSTSLPELEKRSGLRSWKVMSNANVWIDTDKTEENADGIHSTFFPPSSDQADTYNLQRCMRVYPHHQNTGGFFIAVIQKVAPLPWLKLVKNRDSQAEISSPVEQEQPLLVTISDSVKDKSKIENRPFSVFGKFSSSTGYKGYKEDPFIFMDRSDELITELSTLYGISESFPWEHCFTRSEGKAKNNIYMTTSLVSKILATNQADKNVVKIINTGLRVFCRSDQSVGSVCKLRFSQDGCNILFNYFSKRKVTLTESDIIKLLENESISLSSLCPQSLADIKDLPIGPVVFICNPSSDSAKSHTSPADNKEQSSPDTLLHKPYKCFITCPLIFSGWKANWSARLFVTKEQKQHYQVMLGYELKSDVSLEEKKKSRFVRCQIRDSLEPSIPTGNGNEGKDETVCEENTT